MVENHPANAGDARDVGLIPGLGWSPGVGSGNPLQYSCLENSMDRGAWWATVRGVSWSQSQRVGHYWACMQPNLQHQPSPEIYFPFPVFVCVQILSSSLYKASPLSPASLHWGSKHPWNSLSRKNKLSQRYALVLRFQDQLEWIAWQRFRRMIKPSVQSGRELGDQYQLRGDRKFRKKCPESKRHREKPREKCHRGCDPCFLRLGHWLSQSQSFCRQSCFSPFVDPLLCRRVEGSVTNQWP